MPITDYKIALLPFLHANQADKPVFASSAAFKAALDSTPQLIQSSYNSAIDYLNVNFALKSELQGIVLGQIPDGTVTPAKLSFDPATQAELDAAVVSLNSLINNESVGSTIYAYKNIGGAL